MAWKDLLVYVDNDAQCATRLRLAANLAQCCGARLTGIYLRHPLGMPNFARVEVPDDVLADAEASLDALAVEARQYFREAVGNIDIDSELIEGRGHIVDVIAAAARHTDLAILAQHNRDDGNTNALYDPAPLLLELGAPALLVPYVGDYVMPPRRVLIAWNASTMAARAVHDALPLLSAAQQVDVVRIGQQRDDTGDGELVAYLARHGVNAAAHYLAATAIAVDDMLLSYAADTGCELIVMGAYGHSRFRETVLGGMTRGVLRQMTVPVLMSH